MSQIDAQQRVFSDFQITFSGQKEFQQEQLRKKSVELSGIEEAEQREESEMLAAYAEMARDTLEKLHARNAIRLDGIAVSSEAARNAAGFFLANFDQIADAHNMSSADRESNRNDFWLLEDGTEIQQQEAFDRIRERSPELAEDYSRIAEGYEHDGPAYTPAAEFDFTAPSPESTVTTDPSVPTSFAAFRID